MDKVIIREENALEASRNAGALSRTERIRRQKTILYLRELAHKISGEEDAEKAYKVVKRDCNAKVKKLSKTVEEVKKELSNLFLFSEDV